MNISFAHLCDYAMVSNEGKPSAIGIFGALRPQKLPYAHPSMWLVFEIELSTAELNRQAKVEIDFVDADGKKLITLTTDIHPKGQGRIGDRLVIPQLLQLNGITFRSPGDHAVNFFVNGDLKRSIRLQVAAPPAAPPPIVGQRPPQPPPVPPRP